MLTRGGVRANLGGAAGERQRKIGEFDCVMQVAHELDWQVSVPDLICNKGDSELVKSVTLSECKRDVERMRTR